MHAIEFQTTVKKIIPAIPQEKREELLQHTEDETVRVIVLTSPRSKAAHRRKDLLRDAQAKGYGDFLEYLMDYPLDVPNPIRFSRDDLHER